MEYPFHSLLVRPGRTRRKQIEPRQRTQAMVVLLHCVAPKTMRRLRNSDAHGSDRKCTSPRRTRTHGHRSCWRVLLHVFSFCAHHHAGKGEGKNEGLFFCHSALFAANVLCLPLLSLFPVLVLNRECEVHAVARGTYDLRREVKHEWKKNRMHTCRREALYVVSSSAWPIVPDKG